MTGFYIFNKGILSLVLNGYEVLMNMQYFEFGIIFKSNERIHQNNFIAKYQAIH